MPGRERRVHARESVVLLCSLWLALVAAPSASGVEIDPDIELPVTVEKVWYRTAKVRLMGKAFEQTGTLLVSESGIEFSSAKGTLQISGESIQSIEWGRLSPDLQNEWAIVHHGTDGEAAIAAFKGALFSGADRDGLILSALLRLQSQALAAASAGPLKGRVARGQYTSPRDLFVVSVPKAGNWAGVPFTIEEDGESGERNYDAVYFYVRDFGEVMLASVRRIPDRAGVEMDKDEPANVARNLADKALRDWKHELEEAPSPLEDEILATPYGQAALRIYRVPDATHLRGTGGGPTAFPDALIAVVAARRNDHMISAIAEDDASFLEVQQKFHGMPVELRDNREKQVRERLKRRLLEFFGSVKVPETPFDGTEAGR